MIYSAARCVRSSKHIPPQTVSGSGGLQRVLIGGRENGAAVSAKLIGYGSVPSAHIEQRSEAILLSVGKVLKIP